MHTPGLALFCQPFCSTRLRDLQLSELRGPLEQLKAKQEAISEQHFQVERPLVVPYKYNYSDISSALSNSRRTFTIEKALEF